MQGLIQFLYHQTIRNKFLAIKAWDEDSDSNDCPKMLTQTFEHRYCEASLSFQVLKNGDRGLAEVLLQAKMEVEFDLYLSFIHFTEHWSATNYGMGNDRGCSASHLRTYDGEKLSYRIDFPDDSLVPQDFF